VDDCAYRLLLPDGNKNSMVCTQFYQEVARHVSCGGKQSISV
jgi:hypothetical protein